MSRYDRLVALSWSLPTQSTVGGYGPACSLAPKFGAGTANISPCVKCVLKPGDIYGGSKFGPKFAKIIYPAVLGLFRTLFPMNYDMVTD